MNIGIIAACLPTLKPLFVSFFEKARAITSGRTGGGTPGPSGYFQQNDAASHSMNNLAPPKSHRAHIVSVYEPKSHYHTDSSGYVHWNSMGKGGESDEMPLRGLQVPELAKGREIVKTSEVYIS